MTSWMSNLWLGYFWPSLKGNGPEALVQTVVYGAIAAVFVPFVRHFIKREFNKVHAKMDHIITSHPDIPEFDEAKAEIEKWEHWLVTLFRRIFKRKGTP